MGNVTLAQLQKAAIFAELGTLFPTDLEVRALLNDLGVDARGLARLPNIGVMAISLYWRQICERIDRGMFDEVNLDSLVAEAARQFPGNLKLRALAAASPGDGLTGPGDGLRVLCLLACPLDVPELRLREELRIARDALAAGRRPVKVTANTATRRNDIVADILGTQPDILHFCGHGSDDGRLLFEEDNGRPGTVTVEALARTLDLLPRRLSCLVLGSCFGGMFADRLLGPARVIVGSVTALPDRAALEFTRGFYTALGRSPSAADSSVTGETAGQTGPDEIIALAYRAGLAQMSIRGYSTASMRIEPEPHTSTGVG